MVASLHLVTFPRPTVRPPGRATGRVEGLRYGRTLSTGRDDFCAIPANVSRRQLLKPNLREWAFYAIWDSEPELDHFLADSRVATLWRDKAIDSWHLWLTPARVRGRWAGVTTVGEHEDGTPTGPTAILTRLDLSFRTLGTMWLSAVPGIASGVPSVAGLLVGLPMMDLPYLQPMTFTVWRSLDAATAFAYTSRLHQDAVARVRRTDSDIASRFSSARFYPYRSDGTWKHRNPLPMAAGC